MKTQSIFKLPLQIKHDSNPQVDVTVKRTGITSFNFTVKSLKPSGEKLNFKYAHHKGLLPDGNFVSSEMFYLVHYELAVIMNQYLINPAVLKVWENIG